MEPTNRSHPIYAMTVELSFEVCSYVIHKTLRQKPELALCGICQCTVPNVQYPMTVERVLRNLICRYWAPEIRACSYAPSCPRRCATHCNTRCNTLQHVLQHTATCVATHCNTRCNTLQHALQDTATRVATHCNTRCNTRATQCTTLQHIIAH